MNAFTFGGAPRPGGVGHNGGPPLMWDASMLGVTDAEQRAWSFFTSQLARIETETYQIQYPDIRYQNLVPVDTAGGEWMQSVVYFSTDRVGQAQWFHAGAQDVPLVNLVRNQFAQTVQMAAIGYSYNEEELAIATAMNVNLTNDKASAARRAAEEFIDRVALFGDAGVGFTGLINSAAVTAASAAAVGNLNGATNSTLWANKTPDQILADINNALTGIFNGTNTIEMADTVLLPITAHTDLATRRLSDAAPITLLQWLQQANVFTAQTGRPLTIQSIFGLNTAGSGSTGRMVVYRKDPQVLKLYLPMPFQFRQPWRKGPLFFDVPGIFRLGGLDIRRPSAMRYVDGVV